MGHLLDAFFERVASVTLVDRWERVGCTSSPFEAVKSRRECEYGFLLLVVTTTLLILGGEHLWGQNSTAFGLLLFLVASVGCTFFLSSGYAYLFTHRLADRRFLRDCYKLKEYSSCAGVLNDEALSKMAERVLVSFAVSHFLCEAQHGLGDSLTEKSRLEFKEAHKVMLLFGLAEEKWDSYFDKAKEQIANGDEDTLLADDSRDPPAEAGIGAEVAPVPQEAPAEASKILPD
ncbi:MAG: hypothetical protein AAB534_01430 [Patescibacteria group bacterium]